MGADPAMGATCVPFQDQNDEQLAAQLRDTTLTGLDLNILRFVMVLALVASVVPGHAETKVVAEPKDDKALVYLIQPEGSKRHIFADEYWLGVVDDNSYTFSHVDPGVYLVWTDQVAFEPVFLTAGDTFYFEVQDRDIRVLDRAAGEARLDSVARYLVPTAKDRQVSGKKFRKYRKVKQQADKLKLLGDCRFAEAKRARYIDLADSGDALAQHKLGSLHWNGGCVEQNSETAITWYTTAAHNGYAGASIVLGNIYYYGRGGIAEDPAEAARWYRYGAEQGSLYAQRAIASMYRTGIGVEQDMDEAINWYRVAVEQHDDPVSETWLEKIDPEFEEQQRQRAEADARAEVAAQKQRDLDRKRVEQERVATIRNRFGRLGLTISPFDDETKLEPPSRRQPENAQGPVALEYLVPADPVVMLGLLAIGYAFEHLNRALETRLSAEEKETIKKAADSLSQSLADHDTEQALLKSIMNSGKSETGSDLYTRIAYQPEERGPRRYYEIDEIDAVLEVEITGVGLVPVEKDYRPSRLLFGTRARLLRPIDGLVLKQRTFCYASEETPRFEFWAAEGGIRLRAELVYANAATARSVQLFLLGKSDDATTVQEPFACDTLAEPVARIRAEFESGRR